jgi:glycosyltransferase involved in cell wall biosynthesis
VRLLVVSQHFWPENFPILNDTVLRLRDAGLDVRVLTGKPNYPDGVIFPGYRAEGAMTETWRGVTVHRVPLVPRGPGGALRLAANYGSFLSAAWARGQGLLGGWRPDLVFTYATSPILQAFAANRIARLNGAKSVVWVQDLWPESLAATGYVTNPAALRAVGWMVRRIYAGADLLLVQSDALVEPVEALAGRTPVEVQPNPGDAALFDPPPAGAPVVPLPEGFPIVFAGNLGRAQALSTVVEAAALSAADAPAVQWVLVGSGAEGEATRAEAARRGLRNVHLPGRFPPEAMPGLYARAGALLVTLTPDPLLAGVVPSKLQACLAAGRPILAGLDGEGARVVRDAGAGMVAPAGDAAALAAQARALYALPQADRDAMGARGRAYFASHYHPSVLTPRLIAHFERALGERRR